MGRVATKPTRMCMACRKRLPKAEARRYSLDSSDMLIYDKLNTLPGRGVYVCSQICYDKIQLGLRPMLLKAKKVNA
jgi:predicted RNA-binding protein YlxR (DUF448 family)